MITARARVRRDRGGARRRVHAYASHGPIRIFFLKKYAAVRARVRARSYACGRVLAAAAKFSSSGFKAASRLLRLRACSRCCSGRWLDPQTLPAHSQPTDMLSPAQLEFFVANNWVKLEAAVPPELCARWVTAACAGPPQACMHIGSCRSRANYGSDAVRRPHLS